MKKILFLLIFLYSFAFSNQICSGGPYSVGAVQTGYSMHENEGTEPYRLNYIWQQKKRLSYFQTVKGIKYYHKLAIVFKCHAQGEPLDPPALFDDGSGGKCKADEIEGAICVQNVENGLVDDDLNLGCNSGHSLTGVGIGAPACVSNPPNGSYDDNDDLLCNSGYSADGSGGCSYDSSSGSNEPQNIEAYDYNVVDGDFYNKSPHTGLIESVDNSDGYFKDDEGRTLPSCNSGYTNYSSIVVSNKGSYTSQGCGASMSGTPSALPSVSTGADGSKNWTSPDGNNYNLTPNGTLTTNYPDGTSSTKQLSPGDTVNTSGGGSSGSGSSGSGSSGGGGLPTSPGTNGNTSNENNTTPSDDTPLDTSPVSTSCNDSSLTLQEKMMCEMNQGVKKLNSESSPQNSLNQLMKNLSNDSNINATALNTNIKETNKTLESSKSLQENQLNVLNQINSNLKNIKPGGTTSTITPGEETGSNLSDITDKINDDIFSNSSSNDALSSANDDSDSIFSAASQAYTNLSSTFTTVKDNYQDLKDFIDGKKTENATINITSSNLPTKQITIFGQTKSFDCFFNQDLKTLFSPIAPFITFILNIYFVYLSIVLFMKYALANRGGIV